MKNILKAFLKYRKTLQKESNSEVYEDFLRVFGDKYQEFESLLPVIDDIFKVLVIQKQFLKEEKSYEDFRLDFIKFCKGMEIVRESSRNS